MAKKEERRKAKASGGRIERGVKLCQVRQASSRTARVKRRLLDAGDMYVSGKGYLVIGYPPRGRSGGFSRF